MRSQNSHDWFTESTVLAIHDAQIAEHGGVPDGCDAGLLASALARPQNAGAYGVPSLASLAALYALGVIRNHPFIDGNKRVGAVLMETFLQLHGFRLGVSDAEFVETILAVATGSVSDDDFIAWVEGNSRKLPG